MGTPPLAGDSTSSVDEEASSSTGGDASTSAAEGTSNSSGDGSTGPGTVTASATSGGSSTSGGGSTSADACEQFQTELTVDWAIDCTGADGSVTTPPMPAGNYRLTALEGGGTEFPPPWDPPESGWTYIVQCDEVEFEMVRAPGLYDNAAQAFANLASTTEDFVWPGGTLTCAQRDTNCGNNDGFVHFRLELLCP